MADKTGIFNLRNPMRPGKTRRDKASGAWKSKAERNGSQAELRAKCDAGSGKRK